MRPFPKTVRNLGCMPPIVIGDDSGFADNACVETITDLEQGAINRDAFDVRRPGSAPDGVIEMFRKASISDMQKTRLKAWPRPFSPSLRAQRSNPPMVAHS